MSLAKIILLTGIIFYLLTVWSIIDIARKDFGSLGKKALWCFFVFIPFVGCILYILFGSRRGTRKQAPLPAIENDKIDHTADII